MNLEISQEFYALIGSIILVIFGLGAIVWSVAYLLDVLAMKWWQPLLVRIETNYARLLGTEISKMSLDFQDSVDAREALNSTGHNITVCGYLPREKARADYDGRLRAAMQGDRPFIVVEPRSGG